MKKETMLNIEDIRRQVVFQMMDKGIWTKVKTKEGFECDVLIKTDMPDFLQIQSISWGDY